MAKPNYKQNKKHNALINVIVSFFFIAVMAVYPLYIGQTKYGDLTFEKTFAFWIITGSAVLCMLIVLIFIKQSFTAKDYYTADEPVRLFSIAEWAALIFIFWAFLSALLSVMLGRFDFVENPAVQNTANIQSLSDRINRFSSIVWFGEYNRYEGFISFFGYIACFFTMARFYKPKRLHFILLAGSAVIVSVLSVLQFFDLDIFGLFPFEHERLVDEFGGQLYGPLTAFFRTTLGNVNIVSAYCSFTVLLFAALYASSRSRWQYLYLSACIMSFMLSLTTGTSGDAHKVAILGAMVLLIPYWITNRERLGRILIVLAGWCLVYAGHGAYLSFAKRRLESGVYFYPFDRTFLLSYTHRNTALFLILAAVMLAAGAALIFLLKKWPEKPMKIAAIIVLPAIIVMGAAGLEIAGRRFADNPHNIIWQAREMMHGRIRDDFGSARGWVWRNAVEVIPKNPVFGTGPDTFKYALGEERQAEAHERYNVIFDKAHNVFLQIAVCMGIPALLAYLAFLGGVFVPAVKHAFRRPVLFAFGAGALSYTIQSFFAVEVPITTPIVWVALGVMASEIRMAEIGCESLEV